MIYVLQKEKGINRFVSGFCMKPQAFLVNHHFIQKENSHRCCICHIPLTSYDLMPARCKWKHGMRAHRMCEECWFVGKGRASFVQSADHRCPGCIQGLPLHPLPPACFIDLLMD